MLEFSVALFHWASHAICAEKALQWAGYEIKMIPTPRQLSSHCGMAPRYERTLDGQVAVVLKENNIPTYGMFAL